MMTTKENHAMELLVSYLFETHEEEIRNGHFGDAEKPGFAPDVCSYCCAIEQAYTVRGLWDEWRQFCDNVESGEAFR